MRTQFSSFVTGAPLARVGLLLVACLWCIGCPRPSQVDSFKDPKAGGLRRASFEMDCPEEKLTVTQLGEWTIGVSGCGKKAVYKGSPIGWVNNSAVTESKQAP